MLDPHNIPACVTVDVKATRASIAKAKWVNGRLHNWYGVCELCRKCHYTLRFTGEKSRKSMNTDFFPNIYVT